MKCRSCGQTNQLENKFCGFCGTAMQAERRMEERRMIAWEPQQCRICGKTNPPENKFCGMCGAELQADRRREERRTVQPKSTGPRSVASIAPPPARTIAPVDDSNHVATSYLGAPPPSSNKPRGEWVRSSGSSFLGLEDEGPSDSEYLLTDEEPGRGGGFRALIALAILMIVGYLVLKNWDSPTFAAAIAQIKKTSQSGAGATEPKPQTQPSTEQPSISTDENAASADAEKQSKTQPPDTAKPQSQDNSQKSNPAPGAPQAKAAAPSDSSVNKSPDPATNKDEIANNKDSDKDASAIP